MRSFFIALFSVSLIGTALAIAKTPIAKVNRISPFTATFAIYHDGKQVGSSVKSLSYPISNQYHYHSETKLSYLVFHQNFIENSDGAFTHSGYQPQHYLLEKDQQILLEKKSFKKSDQDNMSQNLAVRYYLLANQDPASLKVTTAQGLQTYAFKVIQHENLDTQLGQLHTVHIRFFDNSNNQVDEWLAKKYDYAAALTIISKAGKASATIKLTQYRANII